MSEEPELKEEQDSPQETPVPVTYKIRSVQILPDIEVYEGDILAQRGTTDRPIPLFEKNFPPGFLEFLAGVTKLKLE